MDRLVDVVLSLLAYSSAELPSAPLREAIEALFRAFASQLTQTGADIYVTFFQTDNGYDKC